MELETLSDYLAPGLDLVLVGLNPSIYSVQQGHYFANPRNRFWTAFNRSGIVPVELSAERDRELLEHGIGFTDVVKRPTSQGSQLSVDDYRTWAPVLKEKLERFQPLVACFHGLVAYRSYMRHAESLSNLKLELGPQPEPIGRSRVYVIPNPSPANAQYSLDDLAGWYVKLHQFVIKVKAA